MQRPIKFRCWDNTSKEFLKNNEFVISAEGETATFIICQSLSEWGEDKRKNHDFIIMQSTGLLDSENNPIFEGDLLSYIYHHPVFVEKKNIYICKYGVMQNCGDCFNDSGIGFYFSNNLDINNDDGADISFAGHEDKIMHDLTIIGNYLQHHHLLESEKC